MTKTKFVNCTPHTVCMNDGREYAPCGTIARVGVSFSEPDADGICDQVFGNVVDLPEPQDHTKYIVSAMVLAAAKAIGRTDCVAPATGHKDCVRNEGRIVSVPCFVR